MLRTTEVTFLSSLDSFDPLAQRSRMKCENQIAAHDAAALKDRRKVMKIQHYGTYEPKKHLTTLNLKKHSTCIRKKKIKLSI